MFGDGMHNLPDFVQKLSADSITPGRMALLGEGYSGASSGPCTNATGKTSGFTAAVCADMVAPPPVPTPVLESTSKANSEDVKPKIKVVGR